MSVNVKELKPGTLLRVCNMGSMVGHPSLERRKEGKVSNMKVISFDVNDIAMFLDYQIVASYLVYAQLLYKDAVWWFPVGRLNNSLPEDMKENAYVIMFFEEAQPID